MSEEEKSMVNLFKSLDCTRNGNGNGDGVQEALANGGARLGKHKLRELR